LAQTPFFILQVQIAKLFIVSWLRGQLRPFIPSNVDLRQEIRMGFGAVVIDGKVEPDTSNTSIVAPHHSDSILTVELVGPILWMAVSG